MKIDREKAKGENLPIDFLWLLPNFVRHSLTVVAGKNLRLSFFVFCSWDTYANCSLLFVEGNNLRLSFIVINTRNKMPPLIFF